MYKYFILSLVFVGISDIYSQSNLSRIEEHINKNCENCNLSDLNKLIRLRCAQSDSIIISCIKRFETKSNKEYVTQISEKKRVNKIYHDIFNNLVSSRKNILSKFIEINGDSTENDYNRGILYLYLNENITSVLNFIEMNTFGDFYFKSFYEE